MPMTIELQITPIQKGTLNPFHPMGPCLIPPLKGTVVPLSPFPWCSPEGMRAFSRFGCLGFQGQTCSVISL